MNVNFNLILVQPNHKVLVMSLPITTFSFGAGGGDPPNPNRNVSGPNPNQDLADMVARLQITVREQAQVIERLTNKPSEILKRINTFYLKNMKRLHPTNRGKFLAHFNSSTR
jgi:hypothetical protein